MSGYRNLPDETAQALRHGWLYTGDIGEIDTDGYLFIRDRMKEMVIVSGYNVFPREIEEALLSHSAVSGACVVGRSDARAGEVPVAYVTLREEAGHDALMAFLKETLAAYKLPAELILLDSFPMTPAAKVDRAALRMRANQPHS